jgi:glycosyltransferase involved in cell wall biosynthesis
MKASPLISVVTPTFRRPREVAELLANLNEQMLLPSELLLVDGSPRADRETEHVFKERTSSLRFPCHYIARAGGTAIQRNIGIDQARGDFLALIDDDIRLEPEFFALMVESFVEDKQKQVGGITGYITNQYLDVETSHRWRWYRRLKLFTTYEPGRYDFQTGYPINRYLRPPHDDLVPIDFMGAGCAVWRRQVFADGLRFSEFFRDYGVLEDAHLALRARKNWKLLEHGRARCVHLQSRTARENDRLISRKTAINYRYVFMDIVPCRTWVQEFRFWRVQIIDLLRMVAFTLTHGGKQNLAKVIGKIEGIVAASMLRPS